MSNQEKSDKTRRVAIVVALSNRSNLTHSEEISLKHLRHFLGGYDKYVVAPESLDVDFPDFGIKRFDDSFFGSIQAHIRLLFNPEYYQAFSDYKFMLTYHLDALVFSDELEKWCDMDYDFIGPPWVKHQDSPYAGNPRYEGKVGNSGFSLKKVSSFLEIFASKQYGIDVEEYWRKYHAHRNLSHRLFYYPKKQMMRLRRYNNVSWDMATWNRSEELFIVERASYYNPGFRIAPLDQALKFGFECVPRHCFELNDRKLPFGCHAWERYDREFWEPYLLA
jgi:hypothetical protein